MREIVSRGGSRVRGPSCNSPCARLRRRQAWWCLAVLLCCTATISLGQNKVFTNDDVLKMVKAGFAEETILEAIRTNEPRFDTSAEALLALKNGGVSEKIIAAMLTAARSKTSTAGGSRETDALPGEIGVYVLKDSRYVELATEAVDWRSRFFNPTTTVGSLTKSRLTARLDTAESRLQLSGNPTFLIVCPDGVAAMEYHLLRAEPGKDKREFRVDFRVLNSGVLLALGGTGKSAVRFEAEKAAAGKFKLKLPPLDKGEYAFLPPGTATHSATSSVGKMYTFGLH